ncbi:MAG TPA: hypothetical protein VFR74_14345 [Jiangellales bacterium]|jgi:hypothetical protein|nr:hypothetical protein [Jiangellales bacterium]
MKLLRLAVLGAAVYGAKKWLDENPNAKRQVREAADNATQQARHAMDTARQEVDKRRHKGEHEATGDAGAGFTADSDVPSGSRFGPGASGAGASGNGPSATGYSGTAAAAPGTADPGTSGPGTSTGSGADLGTGVPPTDRTN